jgi:PIN domain nuclease of toxin-antitoxin system
MRFLIDTHALIWLAEGQPELPRRVLRTLRHAKAGELAFSAASVWEMAIKTRLGKLQLMPDPGTYLERAISRLGCSLLSISANHALEVAALPEVAGHRDPFDRLLAAQARVEQLTIISADAVLEGYGVKVVW